MIMGSNSVIHCLHCVERATHKHIYKYVYIRVYSKGNIKIKYIYIIGQSGIGILDISDITMSAGYSKELF